jgi:membrane associated rhomboid family serine protease
MIPLRTDSPLETTPWANWAIIAANVVVFLLQRATFSEQWVAPLSLDPRDPHLLHYFTYQFMHGDVLHLLGNMLFLYIFGNNVADRIGNVGYIAFYLAGGVAAGIGHVLSSINPVIGASGSVSAVTGAFLVLLPRSRVTVLFIFFIITAFEIPSVWLILLSFVKDFVIGFSGARTQVAHFAHLAGSVFGFSVCFALLGVRLLPRDQFDLFSLFQRWNRRRQYKELTRKGFDPFGFTPPPKRGEVLNPNLDRIQDLRAQISEAIAHHKLEEAARLYLELRAIDPNQVLSRQSQLDVANQLFSQQMHPAAADAYELFLRQYPRYEQIEQIQLVLGIIYSRYTRRPDKARPHLAAAIERLNNARDLELARSELARVDASAGSSVQPPGQK